MTVQSYDIHHHGGGFFARLADRVAGYVDRVGERRAEEGRLRQLMALDDRTLRDIGLTRAELNAVAHNPADCSRARRG